jgi:anti-sigma factor ChrR (cupin superfamily)
MRLRADMSQRAVVDTRGARWTSSPEAGVERILLDRDGDEVARATSIVRYAPGSRFARHVHGRGEEFLVLDGEFCDERGSYPRGTYVRNPGGSSHAPFSTIGCTLFVKLRQIPEEDRASVRTPRAMDRCRLVDGQDERELVLHATETERVTLVRYRENTAAIGHAHPHGEEILVLEGIFADEHGVYGAGTWLRQPRGSAHRPRSSFGCLLYVKTGGG